MLSFFHSREPGSEIPNKAVPVTVLGMSFLGSGCEALIDPSKKTPELKENKQYCDYDFLSKTTYNISLVRSQVYNHEIIVDSVLILSVFCFW